MLVRDTATSRHLRRNGDKMNTFSLVVILNSLGVLAFTNAFLTSGECQSDPLFLVLFAHTILLFCVALFLSIRDKYQAPVPELVTEQPDA